MSRLDWVGGGGGETGQEKLPGVSWIQLVADEEHSSKHVLSLVVDNQEN